MERDVSIHAVFDGLAQGIGLAGYFWLGITRIARVEAEVFVDREPLQQRDGKTLAPAVIPDPDGIFPIMFVQDHTDIVPGNEAGLRIVAGLEHHLLHGLAIHLHRDAVCDLDPGDLSLQFDDAQKGRSAFRQGDFTHGVRAHKIPARFEPEQTHQSHPAVLPDEILVFLCTPSQDLVFVLISSHSWYYKRNRPVL